MEISFPYLRRIVIRKVSLQTRVLELSRIDHGTPMLNESDKDWLKEKYPELIIEPGRITGTIKFIGAYSVLLDEFWQIEKGVTPSKDAYILGGSFLVRIQEEVGRRFPTLYLEDKKIEKKPDRHLNSNGAACLFSPLEEDFILPTSNFRIFFQELIIPFLYGQLFFDRKSHWPWQDYSHGPAGILESYFYSNGKIKPGDCLVELKKWEGWEYIKKILHQKKIRGHLTICFCPKRDYLRRCHSDAWKGIIKLHEDIIAQSVTIYFI